MSYKKILIAQAGGPEVLRLTHENELPLPGPEEVRIRVLATSAAFTDILVRKGMYPGVKKKFPLVPGYDLVGLVDKTGDAVTGLEEGQMVAALPVTGAYSEYICLPESKLVRVSDGLDPVEAVSLVLSYVTAYQMLHRTVGIQKNQTILVHGAGGAVGSALLQLGKLLDLTMYGTASEAKQGLIRNEGGIPIDYRKEDFEQRVMDETGDGVDAVFDAIGGENFRHSFRCVKKGGTLVAYGYYNAAVGKKASVPIDFMKVLLWNILPNGKKAKIYAIKSNSWFRDDLGQLFSLLQEKKIKPLIDRVFPLEEAAQAHSLVERAEVKGKIVLSLG